MFSRTAQTVRLYLYHTRYVLSFLSFSPSSGRGEIPVTAVPGCPDTGGSTQRAVASRRVGGELLGDGTAPGRCSVAESSSGELRGRSEVLGLDLRVENLGWSANV